MTYYPPQRITPGKAASVPFHANGVWRARVVAAHADATVDLSVSRIAGDAVFKNIPVLAQPGTPMYAPGDVVYVTFIEARADELLVLGPVRTADTPNVPTVLGQRGSFVFSWPGRNYDNQTSGWITVPNESIEVTEVVVNFETYSSYTTTIYISQYPNVDLSFVIPAYTRTYRYPWNRTVNRLEKLGVTLEPNFDTGVAISSGAENVTVAIQYTAADPIGFITFSWPSSPLSQEPSGQAFFPRTVRVTGFLWTLLTAGTTDTHVEVYAGYDAITSHTPTTTLIIPAGETDAGTWLEDPLELNDFDPVYAVVTQVGSGADSLVVQVVYE